ncbi:MAG: SET domain-containing protein-lysine N-methyltransferase [Bacteroidetes bacterium]|jgi:SET domain-containing protein|nr:SET domain-containing protein-lysine N-methyltransferase [Bacteroidota bacterium]
MTKEIKLITNDHLFVSNAGHKGRGVFTSKVLKKGDLIEICPVIEVSYKDHQKLVGNILENYTFVWNTQKKSAAILLGFGSLYNHSTKPNADYLKRLKDGVMVFKALKTIKVGEEITIDYGEMHSDLN